MSVKHCSHRSAEHTRANNNDVRLKALCERAGTTASMATEIWPYLSTGGFTGDGAAHEACALDIYRCSFLTELRLKSIAL